MHLANGAIKEHLSLIKEHLSLIKEHLSLIKEHLSLIKEHLSLIASNINRENLDNNTEILRKHSYHFIRLVHEALLIKIIHF